MIPRKISDGTRPGEERDAHAPKAADQECSGEAANDLTHELLIDGQEEVFSRTEVESGRFEHHVGEEGAVPVSSSRPKTGD